MRAACDNTCMPAPVQPPRGMRDFLPAEKRRREAVLGVIREVYARHGFDEIETPVMEDTARLHSGLGGDNEKLSFAIMRRGLDGQALADAAADGDPLALSDLGLRFDLTVPLARFYATHRGTLPGVFRALQVAPVWRAERPQRGRYRQFVQCDIDMLGEAGELAEIELLTASWEALSALGLRSCSVRIGDRRLLGALLGACGFPEEQHARALISIDKLDKIGAQGVVAELGELDARAAEQLAGALTAWEPALAAGIAPDRASILAALPPAARDDEAALAAATSIDSIAAAVHAASGARIVYDPTLVRGMGYYTGTIFEIAHPDSGSSVGGGGRYDGMIGRFLGQQVPACGISIGFERIVDLAELPGDDPGRSGLALLIERGAAAADAITVKAAVLAEGGWPRVRVERKPKNLRNLLASLREQGFSHVAHVRGEHVADPASLRIEPIGE